MIIIVIDIMTIIGDGMNVDTMEAMVEMAEAMEVVMEVEAVAMEVAMEVAMAAVMDDHR